MSNVWSSQSQRLVSQWVLAKAPARRISTARYVPLQNSSASRNLDIPKSRTWHIINHREASTATATATTENRSSPTPSSGSRTSETLTLLHKTQAFFPRIVNVTSGAGKSTLEFWERTLAEVYDERCTGPKNTAPVSVVVCAIDEWSGASEMVTAMLLDPLSSNQQHNERLYRRWKDRPADTRRITIREGNSLKGENDPNIMHTSSPWFGDFPYPLEITEVTRGNQLQDQPLLNSDLIKADILIIVLNPLSTSIYTLYGQDWLLNNPRAIIILTGLPPSPELKSKLQNLLSPATATIRGFESLGPKVIFADPSLALEALAAYSAHPSAAQNIHQYAAGFLKSNLHEVRATIQSTLRTASSAAELKLKTTQYITQLVLEASLVSLKGRERDMDIVCARSSEVRARIEEVRAKTRVEVLGRAVEGTSADEVRIAIQQAEKEMKEMMDGLTWWKMVGRIDEIGQIVGNAVDRAWCKDLVDKLILHTGRLSATQESLTALATPLPALIPSPVLQNKLAQIMSSPLYSLSPSSLTEPIRARQYQLAFPTTRLHLAGQKAVLGMLTGLFGGAGVGAYLLGAGVGIETAGASGLGTAGGAMLLCTILGVRWAVGRWEKAKRRWWQDWARVGQGLGRDLEATLDRTVDDQVVIVASHATAGVEEMMRKRKDADVIVREKLITLRDESANLKVEEKS